MPQDFFAILKIAFESLPERYSPILFNKFYEIYPKGFLVAEENKKIIGFIVGINTSNTCMRIPMLAVTKNYRKKQIGSKLLANLIKISLHENFRLIELEVKISNHAAINFYKKHGFLISEKISKFYQTGEDAFIMKKILNSS
jgi:ribosomal-protein-alanine N-acetyltransferase